MSSEVMKAGYKKTEVGMIPKDWEISSIGDVTKIFVGKDLDEESISTFQDEVYKYPVYSNTVDNNGLFGYYNFLEYQGDSVTVVGRGIGLGTAFKRNGEYGAIGRLLVLFPKSEINTGFLTEYINKKINLYKESSGIPQLTSISIAKYNVLVPPLPEQTAIATALSDTDALIASLDKLIAKKKDIKQAAMQELLTRKRRLSGFGEGKGYKQTDIGMIPEDWDLTNLDQLSSITVGFVGSMAHLFKEEGVPLLRGLNVLPNNLNLTNLKYISIDTHKKWVKSSLNLGDVVIVRVGFPGTACVIPDGIGEINAASLVIVRPYKRLLNSHYLCYILNSQWGKHQIYMKLVGGAQQVFNIGIASEFPLLLPPIPEQTAIASILSDMDEEISELEQKRDKVREIKEGMMQELLTGRIRLPVKIVGE